MIAEGTLSLLATTLAASLLGSLHCVGMCGGLMACATSLPRSERDSTTPLTTSIGQNGQNGQLARPRTLVSTSASTLFGTQAAYHGARLASYAMLGAVAGVLGAALDLGGSMVGVQRVASVIAGCTIAVVGAIMLLRIAGARIPHAPMPAPLRRLMKALHVRAFAMPPLARSLTIGFATPLLPCGWLYAFVAIAAGAGSSLGGALVMSAFWLGTVPALVTVAIGLRTISGSMRAALPVVAALVMLAVGLHIAFIRGPKAAIVAASFQPVSSVSSAGEAATHVADEVPACCRGAIE